MNTRTSSTSVSTSVDKQAGVSRRQVLQTGAAAGGALIIGFVLPGCASSPSTPVTTAMANSWVRVGSDNSITLLCARSEMGQGVYTSMPMLIAEELDVDLAKVKVEMAPAGEPYINAMLGGQLTGGSTSVKDAYEKLRVAGAQARAVLVQAAALRWQVASSACTTKDAVVMGPAGQKATYGELVAAASQLVPPQTPKLKAAKDFRYVGKWMARFDTPAKIDGSAEFGIDASLPGMKIAVLAQCPAQGGKLAGFDGARATGMPGVKGVYAISSGVAVVADTYWQARKALEAVSIRWDESAVARVSSSALAAELRTAVDKPGATFAKKGDAEAALRGAARRVEATYEVPFKPHVTMEPMNFIADVRADSCTLVGPTQFQQLAQGLAAEMLKLKPEQVKVRTTFLGGGFGRRVDVDFVQQAVEISKAAGVPVKLIWSREDDMTHDFYRPIGCHKMTAGLDAAGKPVALKFSSAGPSVTKRLFGAFVKDGMDPFMLEAAATPYEIPNQLGTVVIHDVPVPTGYWRSVSHNVNTFANECFIDELAAAAGQDPVAYRRSLLKDARYLRVLNLAAEKSNWGRPAAGNKQGVAVMEGYGTYLAVVSEVSVSGNQIKVHRVTVAADLGSMVNPNIVEQQVESSVIFGLSTTLYDSITIEAGRVQQTNFHNYRVPRMNEVPKIDTHLIAEGQPPGGIGEPVTAMIGPSVANAVFAASGKRLRSLPLKLA
jgi:isoquinoline 1-oxidoreductase subunit beta